MTIRVHKMSLIYFIMLFTFIEPSCFANLEIDSFFSRLRILFFSLSIIMIFVGIILKNYDSRHIRFLAAIYVLYFSLFLSTIFSSTGDVSTFLNNAIVQIGICNIAFLWLEKEPVQFVKTILLYLEIVICINLYTLIAYPEGLFSIRKYYGWFLGYDNTHIRWMLPAIGFSLVYSYMKSKEGSKYMLFNLHYRTIFLICVTIISVSISLSDTSIVALIITALLLFFLDKKDTPGYHRAAKLSTFRVAVVVSLIGTLIVYLISQSYLGTLIENIGMLFDKDMESIRVRLWRNAVEYIRQRPLWGYGFEPSETVMQKLTNSSIQGTSAHNYIINTIYQGGLIGFLAFANVYRLIGKSINYVKETVLSSYVSIIYIAIAIMGLTEPQHNAVCLYAFWMMTCYLPEIENCIPVSLDPYYINSDLD